MFTAGRFKISKKLKVELTILAVIGTAAIAVLSIAGSMAHTSLAQRPISTTGSPAAPAPLSLEQKINGISAGTKTISTTMKDVRTLDDVRVITLLIYNLAAATNDIQHEAMSSPTKDKDIKRIILARADLSRLQTSAFPKLRRAYAQVISTAMWEDNLSATAIGTSQTILDVVNVGFASNHNVRKVEDGLTEMVDMLRFKETRYEWYKGSSYESFTHKPLSDSQIAVMQNGRLIEITPIK